jgi:hypothetical protein
VKVGESSASSPDRRLALESSSEHDFASKLAPERDLELVFGREAPGSLGLDRSLGGLRSREAPLD